MKCKKHLELPTTVHSFLIPLKKTNILIIPHIHTHPPGSKNLTTYFTSPKRKKQNEWKKWLTKLRLNKL